jgi:hypothetical protein
MPVVISRDLYGICTFSCVDEVGLPDGRASRGAGWNEVLEIPTLYYDVLAQSRHGDGKVFTVRVRYSASLSTRSAVTRMCITAASQSRPHVSSQRQQKQAPRRTKQLRTCRDSPPCPVKTSKTTLVSNPAQSLSSPGKPSPKPRSRNNPYACPSQRLRSPRTSTHAYIHLLPAAPPSPSSFPTSSLPLSSSTPGGCSSKTRLCSCTTTMVPLHSRGTRSSGASASI